MNKNIDKKYGKRAPNSLFSRNYTLTRHIFNLKTVRIVVSKR